MLSKEKTIETVEVVYEMFPSAECELKHKNSFGLLIVVILSTQATDVSVDKAALGLFAALPTPEALAAASVEETIAKIKTTDLYRNKTKNIEAYIQQPLERSNEKVP